MSNQKIIIIGAGLAGSLLAIYLAKKGIECEVYEARGDMRKERMSAGRSINLALSNRGIAALKEVGLDQYMLAEAVPMFGRMIHDLEGNQKLLPYSGREGEFINSVSRSGLNIALINEAEKYDEVKFYFDRKCTGFDTETGAIILKDGEVIKGSAVIGTDGAGSVIRNAMFGKIARFDFSQNWLAHGYKELHIPPTANGGFRMEKNALHIWARHSFMMIALPNFDGSFTCTLFLAHNGGNLRVSKGETSEKGGKPRVSKGEEINEGRNPRVSKGEISNKIENPHVNDANFAKNTDTTFDSEPSFADLTDEKSLMNFFEKNFPDAIPLMPTLVEDFFKNPTGNLGTIKCFPWNIGGKSLLLGDAAHAIVPFYGQGMNASFEDCRILNQLIETHGADWETVFDEFTEARKPNADAIAQMAEENFYEMRDAVADETFQKKRQLETKLEQTFPDYFSKYSLVTFREDLPYTVARDKGNAQDKLLMEICRQTDDVGKLNLNEVLEQIKNI